jgi:cytidyltransferase-like protein
MLLPLPCSRRAIGARPPHYSSVARASRGITAPATLCHIRYLQQACALGDALIVALNSDTSARLLTGPERPVTPQAERAEVLAALPTTDPLFTRLPEARVVASNGGTLCLIPYMSGHSTSELIARICGTRTY